MGSSKIVPTLYQVPSNLRTYRMTCVYRNTVIKDLVVKEFEFVVIPNNYTQSENQGYRAVAPDLRGYGETTGAPLNDITKFTIHHLVGDMIGLIDAIASEGEKVFVVGHDWGAIIAWHLCMFRPDRVKGLVNMSVPFFPWNPNGDMAQMMSKAYGEDHYMSRNNLKNKSHQKDIERFVVLFQEILAHGQPKFAHSHIFNSHICL
ncbi:epoxide hydrolase [Artemisia annua]|uniref:Epoxide hydrolase n=1 Tax=Artemisia annua TaxID=35608 RepID=A0A2U1PVH1_ARTAN|nr:epoxide hydrolase [Artemisia annua]